MQQWIHKQWKLLQAQRKQSVCQCWLLHTSSYKTSLLHGFQWCSLLTPPLLIFLQAFHFQVFSSNLHFCPFLFPLTISVPICTQPEKMIKMKYRNKHEVKQSVQNNTESTKKPAKPSFANFRRVWAGKIIFWSHSVACGAISLSEKSFAIW